jgi:hypothetical protein
LASARPALGCAALLLAVVAPASASAAPAVQSTVPCVRYVATKPPAHTLKLTATGWAATTALSFDVGGKSIGTGTTDAAGAFDSGASPFTPPEPKGNLQTFTLTARDAAGTTASTPLRVVRLTVDVPNQAKPSKKVKYKAFGFARDTQLYLFVRRGGKTKGRFTLGKPTGDCGRVTRTLRYMPLKKWSTGTYEYWYSQHKRYSKKTRIFGYPIRIFRSAG